MIQKDLLYGKWSIFLSFYTSEEQQKEADYNENLLTLH